MQNLKIIIIAMFLLGGMLHADAQQAFGIDSIKKEMVIVVAGTAARTINKIPFVKFQQFSQGKNSAWIGKKVTVIKKDEKVFLKIHTFLPEAAEFVEKINGERVRCILYSAAETQYAFLPKKKELLLAQK